MSKFANISRFSTFSDTSVLDVAEHAEIACKTITPPLIPQKNLHGYL